jgi:PAS domain S-box-containing protein
MNPFQNLSIRHKQMLIIMATSSLALLLACAAFMAYDTFTFRRDLSQRITILGDGIGANCAVALDFDDSKTAEEALAGLRADNHVVAACIYARNGRVFAIYQRDAAVKFVPPPLQPPGQKFSRDDLQLFRDIRQSGEIVGTIFVVSDLRDLSAHLASYAEIAGMVFLAALLAALLLSSGLQRVVSNPILHLAGVARAVAKEKNYSLRAKKQSHDELGGLVDWFNEVLGQIQQRGAALQATHDQLEQRVSERTAELAESLSVINATLGSTADGILVVNREGKQIVHNQRNLDLWKIPPAIAQDRDDAAQVRYVMNAVKEPAKFLEKVNYYYAHPDASGQDELELKDGTIVDRITAPVLGKDGRNYGRIWTFRDVTQSRRAEAAVRETQALYHSLVEQLPVGVFRKDGAGRYVLVNSWFCRLRGKSANDLLLKTPAEIALAGDETDETIRLLQQGADQHEQIMRTGQPVEVEERYPDGRGGIRHLQVIKSPVFDSEGNTIGSQGIMVDVTERMLADEALRETQALYYSLVDQLPAGIFRKDAAGRYVFVNAWYCRLKGLDAEQILGKTPLALATVEQARFAGRPQMAAGLIRLAVDGESHHQTILHTGQPVEVEEEYSGSDGQPRFMRVVKSAVFDSDGKIIGSQAILFDVTERKRAEAELAYEQDLLRALLDNSPDKIYFKDAQSRFLKSSRSQARDFGIKDANALVGKTDFDFFSEEHARPAFEDEQEIIRTGEPLIGKVEKEVWNDGHVTWVLTNKMPLRNREGDIIGTLGISKDITALKQAEAELAYERDLLRTLLDTSPDAIFFKDLQSRFVIVSRSVVEFMRGIAVGGHRLAHPGGDAEPLPAHLAGHDPFHKHLIGKTDADIYPAELAAAFIQEEQEIIRTGRPMIGKIEQIVQADGTKVWHMTTKVPWRNKDGQVVGTFGTARDITDLKNAEAKVEAAHQQLLETSRLAGMAEVATNVLHNVGNVLNSVNVSAALVADNAKKSKVTFLGKAVALMDEHAADLGSFITVDPKGRQLPGYLNQLAEQLIREQQATIKELDSLRQHIEHIKDIVAMQQSYAKISGVTEVVNVTDLVEDALRMNVVALSRHGVELVREFNLVPPVIVEKHKVLQILVNLIRNAKHACDDSGRPGKKLRLQVAKTDNGVRVDVVDNGVGIPPENLTRIFNHGFTTRKSGHGFGLHSGALAAKEMGGTLSVHSEGPGCGATFTLTLPLQPPKTAL